MILVMDLMHVHADRKISISPVPVPLSGYSGLQSLQDPWYRMIGDRLQKDIYSGSETSTEDTLSPSYERRGAGTRRFGGW